MSVDNGWNEYSRLVLGQLENLAKNIQSLNSEIQELKQEIARMREREDRVEELRNWKEKIDEIASPSQIRLHIKEIEELKLFKTKAITIFMVVQFLMGLVIAIAKIL
jgi:predicted nuclease with TOPRIM domain